MMLYGGISSPQTFGRLEGRYVGVYDVMREGKSGFEPGKRVPCQKASMP